MSRGTSIALAALCAPVAVALAVPIAASAHSSLVQAGSVPLASPAAVTGGGPWPGRGVARITYFNATSSKWAVAEAVKAWNSSGARVRFVPVPRRRAKVVITHSPGPPSDSWVSGFASIGFIHPGGGYVTLSRLAHPRRPHYNMAGVATHELGHVLGLDHDDRACATMNTSLWAACKGARACRLLEPDDVRGAIRLYGGRARMARPAFCPKPPSRVRAIGDENAYDVTLEWRNPRGPFFDRVQVVRAKGKCPSRPAPDGSWQSSTTDAPGATARMVDRGLASGTRLLTGRYCYGLWAGRSGGPVSRRKTIWVDFSPTRPSAPTDPRAAIGPTGGVTVTWATAPHPQLEAIDGAVARGRCPTAPNSGDHTFQVAAAKTSAAVQLETAGRYCLAVWTRDSLGALAGPATVWVDHKGTAPEVGFGYYQSASLTAEFYDESWDADGDEIVARRWEFEPGVVNDGNEPSPSHTYAAAGTYTVTLTVTDASGLTSTTTRAVTVDAYEDCCY